MRAGILVLGGTSAGLLLAYLAGRRHWRRRKPSPAALALLKTVDSAALEAELARRSVGAHVINTSVRPLHAARAAAIDAELSRLGVASPDALAPGPPRKAYETFARPREGEPCDDDYVRRKAPLMAQQVAFLHRHEQARRNELLRNVDDATQALERAARPRHNVTVVLDNLRSAENVGSIFRTADATRVCRVVTCGFTTTPPDRKLEKTALGALSSVPCDHFEATIAAVRHLRSRGVYVVALETTEDAIPLGVAPQLGDEGRGVAIVLGNEVTGVDKAVMEECDAVVEIPVFGVKNSLNVACCASVALYEVLRRWGKWESRVER
ncbi:hypothetical protein EMIHUDRAFT_469008 [Emiliania huxleyi CCMP1516]|uniref:tRNA/rRNA methyltransferase SpoU type domain-containing protein n=2 Tax=Emiliania huxleyi TaxID=2903 RepID=A0A0D3JS13_EMIH1|nr:hypothetical protein EMIHUDRAFT_469008 [Emiliania huxleyi CCMP1516]EOD26298.1 hypothetical protein EMIHUDRAFT_469008 [Emiliania huxleyi CCMP1516]|mmetsp:Transcript_11865/g.34740  ORF Transcript_11865/g.34740 Transcript_11865/m.34740 type:complete len:324 (+) Transcript_11865:133-1104(+)|eukprot:XP_005778727.1 hypothetical protein EMIHUDRAFT_469008 [Emiliania huxleyi CCMP1516]